MRTVNIPYDEYQGLLNLQTENQELRKYHCCIKVDLRFTASSRQWDFEPNNWLTNTYNDFHILKTEPNKLPKDLNILLDNLNKFKDSSLGNLRRLENSIEVFNSLTWYKKMFYKFNLK